jgi:EamA-like transporter family
VQHSSHANFVRGAIYGLSAVGIWAAFIVVSRHGVRASLTPWDVVAGVLLLPYLLRKGLALERLGWVGLAAISVGCGAPMVLLVNAGLLFAPAAHGGALFPGVMPLMVAMLAAIVLRETLTPQKNVGLVLITIGAITIVWASGGTLGTRQNIGHILFLCAALAWAGYIVAMRRARWRPEKLGTDDRAEHSARQRERNVLSQRISHERFARPLTERVCSKYSSARSFCENRQKSIEGHLRRLCHTCDMSVIDAISGLPVHRSEPRTTSLASSWHQSKFGCALMSPRPGFGQ